MRNDVARASVGNVLGKALANLIFVSFVELVLAPLFIVFYNVHARARAGC